MKNNSSRPSIDGFTLRRRTPEETRGATIQKSVEGVPQQFLRPHADRLTAVSSAAPEILPQPAVVKGTGLRRADIDESLKAVDDDSPKKKPKRKKRWFLRKSVIASFVVVLLLLGGGGYFLNKLMSLSARVFSSGNVLDLLGSGTELKKDANGRTNILVFGTSEDDKGHDGAALTDSVMVVSVDQTNKVAAMVSMPRDLWVKYDTPCQFGYQGKINVVYECAGAVNGDLNNIDVVKGTTALQKKVGEVFGLDVQYYVKVNYSVVREVTTALGGVTVNVQSSDPRGIYDYNTKIKLPNGPATLQGEQALAFVRARGDGGGYGFDGSNFAREQNQQKMIIAIRDKALSVGTLTNPVAMSSLMDSLGNNIKTNFSTGEMKTLANLAKNISADKVTHISLIDKTHPVVTTGSYNGQSIVKPIAGIDDFSKIQSYIRGILNGGSIESENATIQVLNGSGKVGAASTQQTELTQAGLLNVTTGNTTYVLTSKVVWYDTTGGKDPKTQAKLASVLGKQPSGATLPAGVQSTADFVIILGKE